MREGNPVVDSHVHFWDPRVLSYPWLTTHPRLNGPRLPDQFTGFRSGAVEQLVFVEANCDPRRALDEIAMIDALATRESRITCCVAYVDLTNATSRSTSLAALERHSRVTGIRHNIQAQPRGFALSSAFVAGVHDVAERNMTFDLCATADQLDDVIGLVTLCPDAHFVLDHCGKPAIRDNDFAPWAQRIERLAAHRSVTCKVSGLLTEARPDQRNAESLRPYVEHVRSCFGPGRLMYGSDWPVVDLAGGEPLWRDILRALSADWPDGERDAFYRETAINTYRMVEHV